MIFGMSLREGAACSRRGKVLLCDHEESKNKCSISVTGSKGRKVCSDRAWEKAERICSPFVDFSLACHRNIIIPSNRLYDSHYQTGNNLG